MKKTEFDIIGMTCSACQSHVQRAVEKLDGVVYVNVNLLSNSMTVSFNEKICSEIGIEEAVKKAGYEAIAKTSDKKNSTAQKQKKENSHMQLASLILSFVFLIVLMYFSMGNMMWDWYAPAVFDHHQNPMGFALIQFILLIPIVTLNFHYFKSGFKKLFALKPNMDSLIAVGSGVSILYGIFALFMISLAQSKLASVSSGVIVDVGYWQTVLSNYHDSIYFESAGMILTLVSLGKYLEGISKKKTTQAIEKLIDLAPKTAVILENGIEKTVDVSAVKVGDIVTVKRGQSVPIDGKVVGGSASVNESSITGESIPVSVTTCDKVYSSSIVENGYIQVRAESVGEDTSFARVIKLVEEASNSKAPISKLADKISGVFVPIIFVISILTFVINLLVSHSFEFSLGLAITVIVIACPCALGLATPVAIMVGTGKGAENGLLIKNAEIMEKAHLIKTIVFDKTGTITEGKPRVVDYETFEGSPEILNVLYSIEKKSEHPLALSITEFGRLKNAREVEIQDFENIDGYGLKAKHNGSTYYIGNINFISKLNINAKEIEEKVDDFLNQAKIPLIVIKDDNICAIITIKDNIKPNSKLAIKLLKKAGIKVVMLTGDNEKTAKIVAEEVGVDEVIAGVKPEEKQKVISSLKSDDKHLVAMVGDGVNDAPALSSADLGISIGAGSEIAIETSDIVLQRNDLLDVLNIIKLSKRVLNTIKLSLFWAFFYNLVCVVIATGVFYYPFGLKINPMIGSIAMSLSSVSVVLSALTINFFKPVKLQSKDTETENFANAHSVLEFGKADAKTACELNVCKIKAVTHEKFQDETQKLDENQKAEPQNITRNMPSEISDEIEKTVNVNSEDDKEINLDDELKSKSEPQDENQNRTIKNINNKGETKMEFYVKGMMCQNCVNHIKTALEGAGVIVNEINLETKKVSIQTEKEKSEIFEIIKSAGYEATEN